MNPKTSTRYLTRLVAAVALVFGVLAVTPTAQAEETPETAERYGYAKVMEYEAYLPYYVNRGAEILHVPERGFSDEGFWFARRGGIDRSFTWVFQRWGKWCGSDAMKVEFNPWRNTHTCVPDMEALEVKIPGTIAATEACRESTGQPWKTAWGNEEYCADQLVSPMGTLSIQPGGSGDICAPWEDQNVRPKGNGPKCADQHYAWENEPGNTYWAPEPDTCTGMPAFTNKNVDGVIFGPSEFVPTGPVPDCDGSDLPPNCEPDTKHQACTGVPVEYGPSEPETPDVPTPETPEEPQEFTVSETATVTVDSVSVQVGDDARVEQKRVVHKVTKRAQRKYRGKTYRGKHTVKVTRKRAASASALVTATGSGAATATAECVAYSESAATRCALNKAQALAGAEAHEIATADARARAQVKAKAEATRLARQKVRAALNKIKVTKAQKRKAAATAQKKARAKAVAKVKKAKRARR